MIYIYALLDPVSGDVKYVGKSKNPAVRLRSHINVALRDEDDRRKSRWIRKLCSQGLEPELRILEEAKEDNWEEAECKWIAYYRGQGIDLCNHTDGGDGVHNPDIESRRRLSDSRKQLWQQDAEFREKMRAVYRDPERRWKISVALTGKSHTPEHVAKRPQNRKGFKPNLSERTRQMRRNCMLGNQHCKGVFPTDETKQRISVAVKAYWESHIHPFKGKSQSHESNLKRSKTLSGKALTESHKKRIAEGAKRRWAENPPPEDWGTWKRIDWPSYEWLEKQLETMTIRELAAMLEVKFSTLARKLRRERKKRRKDV